MATIVIRIQLEGNGPGIILNDGVSNGPNIITMAQNDDVIKWKLIPNSGIDSLDGINDKSGNVFCPNPSKNQDGSWQGVVKAPEGAIENYLVEYTFHGVQYNHDPQVQVHQRS
jgi:hypothetical protein